MSLEEGKELYEIGFHLISSLAAEQAQEEFSKLQDGLGKLAEVISAKEPELINLEYTMVKTIDRKHERFDTAHFAYITFITSPDKVQSIKDLFDGEISVLRHLIIKTTADAEESLIKVNEIFAEDEEEEMDLEEGRAFVAAAKKAKDSDEEEFEFNGKKFPVTIKEKKVVTEWLHTNFSNFTSTLNEAFSSQLLASLFKKENGKLDNSLAKAFYGKTKIAMDKVQDEDLISTTPSAAYKAKGGNTITFYISDNEKNNIYASEDAGYYNKTIPGGGYLLAVTSGDNKFYDNAWANRYTATDKSRTLVERPNKSNDTIGISKKYKGWDGTGLYNVKRISEVADRAVVVNVDLLQQKYSTTNKRDERNAAKSGATAFKSDKDFKAENKNRYEIILQNKAAKLPLDKIVADAIDLLTDQIKQGLAKGEKGKYGDLIIGISPNGRETKMRDASNHMSNILDNYARYVDYVKQEEDSVAQYGQSESWYARSIKQYAKAIKDGVDKIESFNYAW